MSVRELFSLERRIAVVTGASSGIGRAMAQALADAGASVVLVARRPAQLADAEQAIAGGGGRCATVAVDLANREAVAAAAVSCAAAFGEPDILVNAAGLNIRLPLGDLTTADWDAIMAVNLTAPFLLGQRFGPSMAERGFGRIINVGSQQSFRAFGNSGAYGAAKSGLVALSRSQAEAWSARGVCCNAVIPGIVSTPMTAALLANPQRAASLAARTMTGRIGTPEDFCGVCVFLASPASGYVTGQAVFVDGGFSAT